MPRIKLGFETKYLALPIDLKNPDRENEDAKALNEQIHKP